MKPLGRNSLPLKLGDVKREIARYPSKGFSAQCSSSIVTGTAAYVGFWARYVISSSF
jgi:hypothetical protein